MRVSGNFLFIMSASASGVFIARLSGGGNLFVFASARRAFAQAMAIAKSGLNGVQKKLS